jgi:long-chain acyl-CoA synthetase
VNYCDLLFAAPAAWLDNEALVDVESGRRYTYRELQRAVRRFAGWVRGAGYAPGEVLATHLYNGAEAVIAHLGVQYAGCKTCLLDPLLPPASLPYYLQDSGAVCLLTHLKAEVAGPHAGQMRVVEAAEVFRASDEAAGAVSPAEPFDFAPDAITAIFYTSGTTSQPKGVMLGPQNFDAHYRIFTAGCYTYTPADRLLCFVPFSHGYGSKSVFLPCLAAGGCMVIMRAFQPMRVVDTVARERVTHLFGVPSHYQQLLRRPEWMAAMRGLRAAFSAAAVLKLETADAWREQAGFELDEGYGLIETCTGVAFRVGRPPVVVGDVGAYPEDLVTVECVDETLQPLPPGARGEIAVRGPNVMAGYLNKPEETAAALRDGWFLTGDMGYKTPENAIVMVGRIKDVINVAGIKVAPFEVEAALSAHPAVNEAAVLGVADDMYGEVVKAYVKLNTGCEATEREIVKFLGGKLMNFQTPKSIAFVDEFPRNNMGKVDKKALREQESRK